MRTTTHMTKATIVAAVLLTMLAASPGVGDEGELIDGFDPGRIVEIEWALAVGLEGPLSALNPTDAELAAAERRMAFTDDVGLEDAIREELGLDRFGGMWLGFDGTVNLAYVGERPVDVEGSDRHQIVLHERETSFADLMSAAAERGNARVDVRTGTVVDRNVTDLVRTNHSGVSEQHNVLNRLPGVELAVLCDGATGSAFGQLGYFVTWVNDSSVRQYGWLTSGHHLIDPQVSCTKASTASDGVEKWTDNDLRLRQDGDSSSRVEWTDRTYRGVYKYSIADAVVIKMSEANAEKERIHLYGTTVSNSRSAPSDWDMHSNPLKDVHAATISTNTTLCGVFEAMGGLKCGWYDGPIDPGDQYYEISWSGSPFPQSGDSGAPIFTATSISNGGPRAVGIYGGLESPNNFDDDYFFYRVHEQLNELADKYSVFAGTLEVCSRSADGSWDYNCDPSNG